MTDDLDPLRRLCPGATMPDDPPDLEVLSAERRHLLTHITGSPTIAAAPRPSIYPRLVYRDERAALEFLVRAFGFVERREARLEHETGMLAWLELGTGLIAIGRAGPEHHGLASPADVGAPTAMMMVDVNDADAHHRRAAAEGARIESEPQDMLWGDRRYEALDLDGHRWYFAQRRISRTTR